MHLISIWTISRYLSYMDNIWIKTKQKKHCCMISRYWPYTKKTWEKGKTNQSAVAPFQILAGYGENMEGNCNIIFVTLFQAWFGINLSYLAYSPHSPTCGKAIGFSSRNVNMISPLILPNSLEIYEHTHSFLFHHTFIKECKYLSSGILQYLYVQLGNALITSKLIYMSFKNCNKQASIIIWGHLNEIHGVKCSILTLLQLVYGHKQYTLRFARQASVHFWFIFPVICATVGGGWNLAQTFPVKYVQQTN